MKLLFPVRRIFDQASHRGLSSARPVGWTRKLGSPRPGISLIAGLVVPLLLSSPGVGLAQIVDTTLWVTNGLVNSIVPDGNTIYIGGGFTQVGPATGGGVAIDASSGAAQQPYPRAAGNVYAVAPDGTGGWYLGGAFTAVRGQPRNNLARLDAAGNLTPWNPNANSAVTALAVSGGTVYAAGYFTSVGGQPRNLIAALDGATGTATAFNPNPTRTPEPFVDALAVSGGTVYAGGGFTSIGGQPRSNIAALDAATGAATSWAPNASGGVYALAVSGGTVYAGGSFGSIGGQLRSNIAAIDAATGAATAWSPNASDYVTALAVSGGTVYAGGKFSSIGGQPRNLIAALDAVSGAATPWDPNPSGGDPFYSRQVSALAISGGTIYAGGVFSSIGGQPRNYIAALDAASGSATAWNPNAGSRVTALAVSGGKVYAGGEFSIIGGGQPRSNLAAIDAATGALTGWSPNANGRVNALAVSGGTVYAAGLFTSIGGQPRNRLAAVDASSGAATPWDPNPNDHVIALEVSGGTIYAGGWFTSIGGQPRYFIAAIDAATGAATAWNPDAGGYDCYVSALAVSGGTVYAGGTFEAIGGQLRNNIAALDATTGAATAWNPDAGPNPDFRHRANVQTLAVSGGTVYVGGGFTTIGGQPRNNLAALDATTGAATAWDPNPNYYYIFDLEVSGGTIKVGGGFDTIGGQPRNCLAALYLDRDVATTWAANANSYVNALATIGGRVWVGGSFTSIGGQPQSGIAAITESYPLSVGGDPSIIEGSLTAVPNPTGAGTQIQYSVVRPGRVRLELLDVSGRVEATLADRVQEPGRHVATWDGVGHRGRLSPGLHFLRLVGPDGVMVRKLAIVR